MQTAAQSQRQPVLVQIGVVSVGPLTDRFDAWQFFHERTELSVRVPFEYRVLASTRFAEPAPAVDLLFFDLQQYATDLEVKSRLPTNASVSLWHIAKLIEKQSKGEAGPLLTNSRSNVFFLAKYVVWLAWNAAGHWQIDGWEPDTRWRPGARFFCTAYSG